MGVTAFASGTQSATVTTEHFLSSINVGGVFSLTVDTVNMVALDVLELRAYQMVLTGGTQRKTLFVAYYGAQPAEDLIKVSIPLSNELTDANALRFSLLQSFGTSRNFPWKVLRHN